jgi:hypothetical protein
MKATPLIVPIKSAGFRSNELDFIQYSAAGISVYILEENTEKKWQLLFLNTQALRVTTWESANEVLRQLPHEGGFFELFGSDLCRSLGVGTHEYMQFARHFVISCYDQVVEVVAYEVKITCMP